MCEEVAAPLRLVGSASALLAPLLRMTGAGRKAVAATVRLYFSATVAATGLSCTGFVAVCLRHVGVKRHPIARRADLRRIQIHRACSRPDCVQ